MEKKLEQNEIKTEEIKEIVSQMRKSQIDSTNEFKMQSQLLQEKMAKTKKVVNLQVEDDFKTEYLAPAKDKTSSEAQCDIWEKPDIKTLLSEKVEQKNKKKPKSVSSL